MGDVLSQSEIDELLNALSTGDIDVSSIDANEDSKKIKLHDFRRPSKFAKDHLKTLHIIYDNYARALTNFLSGYLRTIVQIEVLSVEPLTYHEFNNSIINPVILGICELEPLNGNIIIEVAPNSAFAMIDRILGGRGVPIDKIRGFTEVELVIMERIVIELLNYQIEPWENVVKIRPKLEKIETNAQFAQIISPNEIIALVTLSAKIGESDGLINMCIPYMVVEPVIAKLSTSHWFSRSEKEKDQAERENIESRIAKTKIPVSAVLGRTSVTVNEVVELNVGDVIILDSKTESEIDVLVGDKLKFKAKPGVKNNQAAFKVEKVLREEA